MAECFSRNTKTRRPLLITQNGVASKVIINADDFDNIRETLELIDDLQSAEAELDRANSPPRKRNFAKPMPSASKSSGNWGYDPLVETRKIAPYAMRPIHCAGKRRLAHGMEVGGVHREQC